MTTPRVTPGKVERTSTTPAWNYLECEMLTPVTAGRTVTLSIHLSAPVTNLGFRIHDIDKTGNSQQYGWDDLVIVNTPGKAFTYTRGTNVRGTRHGWTTRSTTTCSGTRRSTPASTTSTSSGPVRSRTCRSSTRPGTTARSGNQHIGIGNISFSDCVANPKGVAAPSGRAQFAGGGFVPGKTGALVEGRDN